MRGCLVFGVDGFMLVGRAGGKTETRGRLAGSNIYDVW